MKSICMWLGCLAASAGCISAPVRWEESGLITIDTYTGEQTFTPCTIKGRLVGVDDEERLFYTWIDYTKPPQLMTHSFDGTLVNRTDLDALPQKTGEYYAVSRNRQRFAYYDGKTKSIRVFDVSTSTDEMILPDAGQSYLSGHFMWQSNNHLLVFFDRYYKGESDFRNAIVRATLPGKKVEILHRAKILTTADYCPVTLSSDQRHIAFIDGIKYPQRMKILDTDTKDIIDVGEASFSCRWSPDGEQLAYTDGIGDIVVYSMPEKRTRVTVPSKGLAGELKFVDNDRILCGLDGGFVGNESYVIVDLRTGKSKKILKGFAHGMIPIDNGRKLLGWVKSE